MKKQIWEGTIIHTLILGAVRTNCYFLSKEGSKEIVVIDPADHPKTIIDYITKIEGNPVAILLTHGHFDHILAAKELAEYYQIPIGAGKKEKRVLEDSILNCSKTMGGAAYTIQADVLFEDKEEIRYGKLDFQTLSTPGHTVGGVCYYLKEHKLLFSGDTLFAESVGRTDLPTGNSEVLISSLKETVMQLPDDVLVLPGHGDQTKIGYERKYNPYCGLKEYWE